MLFESTLVELYHATLVLVMYAMMTLSHLIALRVIGNYRRRATFHIVMILIASQISVQGFSSFSRVTVTGDLPLNKVRFYRTCCCLLLETILFLSHCLLGRGQVRPGHELHIVGARFNRVSLHLRDDLVLVH